MRRGYVCADADGQTLTIHTHARMHARTHTHTHTHTHTRTHHTQDCRFLTHPAVNPFMSLKKDVAITDLKYIINRSLARSLSVSLCPSLSLSFSLSLSLSLSLALSLVSAGKRGVLHQDTRVRALSLIHTHTLACSTTHTRAHTHSLKHTKSHTYTLHKVTHIHIL